MGSKIICVAPEGQGVDASAVDSFSFQINDIQKSDDGRALFVYSPQPYDSISVELDGLDCFVLNSDAPKPKMLIADMDSTIVESETLDDLAVYFGIEDKVAEITERAMRGEIDFESALTERVAMLKGLPEQAIFDSLRDIKISRGAESLIYMCKKNSLKTYLVSGGFKHVTGYIADNLGFDDHFGNEFIIKDSILTGDVKKPIQNKDSKLRIMNDLCDLHEISLEEVITIGDGANDIPMLQAAGYGIAYKAKPKVVKVTRLRIDYTDLSAAQYIL